MDINLNLAAERAIPTPLSSSPLLPLLLLSLATQKNSPDTSYKIRKEYDYIVVGSGAAGSVVAARLSEVPCVSVLLLEAGSPPPLLTDVPALAADFWLSKIDWNYITTPQKYTARGLINRQIPWPSGKTLGGSTVYSGGLHVVGNRKDYDNWASMGATGWSYKEVLPYFKKLEDNRDHEYVANGYHGVGGPVTVMRPSYESPLRTAVNRAAKSLGYKIIDSNDGRQTGFYDPQSHLRHNQKCSTAKAYLVPAEDRKNLDILSNAFVKKVIINKRRATGVLFEYAGKSMSVRAKREVILSAGAVNTPKLLMLSGVGPKEELRKLNIPVHADLPVGKNLQDHVGTSVDFIVNPHFQEYRRKLDYPESIKQYVNNRTGPLASTIGITNIAFLRDDEIHPKKDWPNYQVYFVEGPFKGDPRQMNVKPEVYQQVYGPYEKYSRISCIVSNLRPKSHGRVMLKSKNPYDPPLINPNYLADVGDLQDIVEGMKACKRIGTSHYMRNSIGAELYETLYPGCEKYANDDDAYYACQTRSVVFTYSHACGTAKMGDPRDPTTVVDPKLRVKKIKGLRVVDASVMPSVTSGNTEAPSIMIGEKGSDIIKESIKCYNQKNDYSDYLYDNGHNSQSSSYPYPPEDADEDEYEDECDRDYDGDSGSLCEDNEEDDDEGYNTAYRGGYEDSYQNTKSDPEDEESSYDSPSREPLYDSDLRQGYGNTGSYRTRNRNQGSYQGDQKFNIPSLTASAFREYSPNFETPYLNNPRASSYTGVRKSPIPSWASEMFSGVNMNRYGRYGMS